MNTNNNRKPESKLMPYVTGGGSGTGFISPSSQVFTITNLTPSRSLAGDETSAAAIAAVLATLITDLKATGIIK